MNPGGGPMVAPYETMAPSGGDCSDCHGSVSQIHQGANHTATPGSGYVVIFADDDHDDAGWFGTRPYFDVLVDCNLCHSIDLTKAHAQRCQTCHPTPVNSLGTWSGGCSEGGCHQTFHEDSIPSHVPFSSTYEPENDCDQCHNPGINAVEQSNCLKCHAAYGSGDITPPVTSSNAQAFYTGPGLIKFVVTDGGKVGVGTTFYTIDNGLTKVGSTVLVTAPGPHTLQFWSVDQAGNIETPPKQASFTIIQEKAPPVTTSNAASAYYNGAVITFSATDAGTMGVKATYYTLNSGSTRTGTTVSVPALNGMYSYELVYWSEDWAGNVEDPHSVVFTVTSGSVTLRLVWGDSDSGNPPSSPDDWADWYIRRGGPGGHLVVSGSNSNPGWDGIDDVIVPVSGTPCYVSIDWWDSYWGWDDNTTYPSVGADTPGEIIILRY